MTSELGSVQHQITHHEVTPMKASRASLASWRRENPGLTPKTGPESCPRSVKFVQRKKKIITVTTTHAVLPHWIWKRFLATWVPQNGAHVPR
jgi:hypothetical protein